MYIYRRFILRYRGVRHAVEIAATIGAALLFSYLILHTRW